MEIDGKFVSLRWVELVHEGEFRYGRQWCFMGISGYGFARVWVYDAEPDTGHITDLSVSRGQGGRGIGSDILKSVETYSRARGVRELRLSVRKGARFAEFYLKRGYRKVSEDAEIIEMSKTL